MTNEERTRKIINKLNEEIDSANGMSTDQIRNLWLGCICALLEDIAMSMSILSDKINNRMF